MTFVFTFKIIHYCWLMYMYWNMYLRISRFHPVHFLPAPGLLACLSAFGNAKVKLDLSTDTHMLLIVEKSIRSGICHA